METAPGPRAAADATVSAGEDASDPPVPTREAAPVAESAPAEEVATPTPGATDHAFSEEILPILEDVCARCHTPGGPGSTEWELATAEDALVYAPTIRRVTQAGVMPPWPASGLSVPFVGDPSLSEDQLAALARWAEGGVLDVDPDTPVEPTSTVNAIVDPDLVATSSKGPYQGSTEVLDDYRCLVFDLDIERPQWALASQFEPDRTEVVHHAIVTLASAELRSQAEFWDATEPGPGWTCYGGNGLDAQRAGGYQFALGGWAPGANVARQPDGYAIPLRPGDFLVVQIHYHFDDQAPPDLSRMVFDLASDAEVAAQPGGRYRTLRGALYLGPAEIPCYEGDTEPLCDRDAALQRVEQLYGAFAAALPDAFLNRCGSTPADYADMTDGTAWSSCDLPVTNPGRITSVTGHMHELGLAFRMTLNPDTAEELILLDIPDWSFEWQFGYRPVDDIVIDADDVIRVECSWNRERAPYEAVGYVLWAEGTGDEMCYSSITTAPLP